MKNLCSTLVVCLLPILCQSQNWIKRFHYTNGETGIGRDVCETHDGGFLVVGNVYLSSNPDTPVIQILKLDRFGQVMLDKGINLGSHKHQLALRIGATPDGGFVISGVQSLYSQNQKLLIIKIDSIGNIQWENAIPNQEFFPWMGLKVVPDGVLVSGMTLDTLPAIWKFDFSGANLWVKEFPFLLFDIETNNSNEILTTGGYGPTAASLVRADSLGDMIESKQIILPNSMGNYQPQYLTSASDGGYCLMGQFNPSPAASIQTIKLDAAGNLEWEKHYDILSSMYPSSIKSCPDGGFIIGSAKYKSVYNDTVSFLLKIDQFGNYQWHKSFYSDGWISFRAYPVSDGYIGVGVHKGILVVKTDGNGNITASNEPNVGKFDLDLFPNPTNGVLHLGQSELEVSKIEIFDCLGNRVREFLGNKQTLNLEDLPTGVFWIRAENQIGKFILDQFVKN